MPGEKQHYRAAAIRVVLVSFLFAVVASILSPSSTKRYCTAHRTALYCKIRFGIGFQSCVLDRLSMIMSE